MASIRQRSGTWQARVIREGFPAEVKSFATRSEAQKWARQIENAMDGGGYRSGSGADRMLLADALDRYSSQVSPSKRGHLDEVIRINALKRAKMAGYSMANLSPAIVAGFRDDRLRTVGAGAVIPGFCTHKGAPRSLLIWDESLISSDTTTLQLRMSETAMAHFADRSKRPLLSSILDQMKSAIHAERALVLARQPPSSIALISEAEPGCGDLLNLVVGGLVVGADAAVGKDSGHPWTPSVQKGGPEITAVHNTVKLAYGHGATGCP